MTENGVVTAACDSLIGRIPRDSRDRLANAQRGTLTGSPYSGIDGTPPIEQVWSLDALGNWAGFNTEAGGSPTLTQSRSHNDVNEITDITGGSWAVPCYDARGNMIAGPHGGESPGQRLGAPCGPRLGRDCQNGMAAGLPQHGDKDVTHFWK